MAATGKVPSVFTWVTLDKMDYLLLQRRARIGEEHKLVLPRKIVKAVVFDNRSIAEVAQERGVTEAAIINQLNKSRKWLATEFAWNAMFVGKSFEERRTILLNLMTSEVMSVLSSRLANWVYTTPDLKFEDFIERYRPSKFMRSFRQIGRKHMNQLKGLLEDHGVRWTDDEPITHTPEPKNPNAAFYRDRFIQKHGWTSQT